MAISPHKSMVYDRRVNGVQNVNNDFLFRTLPCFCTRRAGDRRWQHKMILYLSASPVAVGNPRGLVGAAGFEPATPYAQEIGVISRHSIVYIWFPIFPTTWGICFSLKRNPSRVNRSSFGTVMSQLGLAVSIIRRLREDRHVEKQIT